MVLCTHHNETLYDINILLLRQGNGLHTQIRGETMIGLVDGNNFFVSCERVFNRRLVGRPVAVLSNNDGRCVSRSNEFKALGIPMGTPYFQLKHREASGELCFCSSNYELYGDMSRRIISILREEAVDVEQYSIDEAFIFPPTTVAAGYAACILLAMSVDRGDAKLVENFL